MTPVSKAVLDGPPQPNKYDRRVRRAKGTTSALDMRPDKMQHSKRSTHLDHEERYFRLTRRNCAYRRELAFFRACFEPSKELVTQVGEIAKQLILYTYYHSEEDLEGTNDELLNLATSLQQVTQAYEDIIEAAADGWVAETEQEARCARADRL
jgi:hypothetical protein